MGILYEEGQLVGMASKQIKSLTAAENGQISSRDNFLSSFFSFTRRTIGRSAYFRQVQISKTCEKVSFAQDNLKEPEAKKNKIMENLRLP